MENNLDLLAKKIAAYVEFATISPEDALKTVNIIKEELRKSHPDKLEPSFQDICNKIINKYANYAGIAGAGSTVTTVVPGFGTLVGASLGILSNSGLMFKCYADMARCMVIAHGEDIASVDRQKATILIAIGAALDESGVSVGSAWLSKISTKTADKYLRGPILIAIKEFLKKFGIKFTKKWLLGVIPFGVGMAVSAGLNYWSTRGVGAVLKRMISSGRFQEYVEAVAVGEMDGADTSLPDGPQLEDPGDSLAGSPA